MSIPSETVALPITKGVDLTTDDRLLSPPSLLEAQNSRFPGGAAHKRRGHVAHQIKGSTGFADVGYRPDAQADTDFWNDTGLPKPILGTFSRDDEMVAWDGVNLFSYLPSQTGPNPVFSRVNASMPALSSVAVGKWNEHQSYPEMADNGVIRVVFWVNQLNKARYAVYDSVSGALITSGTLTVTTASYGRVYSLQNWMHIVVKDADDGILKMFSLQDEDPTTINYQSVGPATHFDVWKQSDTKALVIRTQPEGIYINWYEAGGVGSSDSFYIQQFYKPTLTSNYEQITAARTDGGELALAWYDSAASKIGLAVIASGGGSSQESTITGVTGLQRITVTPRGTAAASTFRIFDLFWDNGTNIYRRRFANTGSSITLQAQHVRYNLTLASRAWFVGDRTFLWAAFTSGLGVQSTWFLLDEALLPVGRCDFAVANTGGLSGRLAGINWTDSTKPHLALSYKLRVESTSKNITDGIYTEPSIRAIYLNHYPALNTAQAGRTTYIAGAQLWAYDGKELVEAGFHLGPEASLSQSAGGGLTTNGTYSYRIDLCHRNEQNEEVRSLSILTPSTTLAGTNKTFNITWNSVLTRRSDSYFLIYRNAMSAGVPLVNWWLLNSRDPADASYRANDLTLSSLSFTDTGAVSDTIIQTHELHPASDTYIQPVSAPACEVVAAGRDRLWVAGGELLPGQIAPSRLFDPGECPTFNPYLAIQVDRSNEAVTAIGFVGEVAAIFREHATYILDSDGPDNNGAGTWNYPRLALADIGAVSQKSVARIAQGLIFQSPAGFRVLGAGGALTPIGQPIDAVAKDLAIVGTLVVEKDQEVRFYTASEAYVYNYLYDTWAKWTCGGVGITKGTSDLAVIARSNGYLWVETDGVWKDGGTTYEHRIRTSWLHGGNVGEFQRVRSVGGIGRFADLSVPNHNLRLEFYFDSREFWEDRHEWTYPDSTVNQDTWGAATWGAGVWGDTTATISNLEDLDWDWQKDPAIQKCNSVSIALQDYNTDGPGFVLSAFTLELARKSGLDRGPTRTGTGSYRT